MVYAASASVRFVPPLRACLDQMSLQALDASSEPLYRTASSSLGDELDIRALRAGPPPRPPAACGHYTAHRCAERRSMVGLEKRSQVQIRSTCCPPDLPAHFVPDVARHCSLAWGCVQMILFINPESGGTAAGRLLDLKLAVPHQWTFVTPPTPPNRRSLPTYKAARTVVRCSLP